MPGWSGCCWIGLSWEGGGDASVLGTWGAVDLAGSPLSCSGWAVRGMSAVFCADSEISDSPLSCSGWAIRGMPVPGSAIFSAD